MDSISQRKDCRICKGMDLVKFLDFGNLPLAGGFIKPEQTGEDKAFPLRVYFCRTCKEVQLLDVVPSGILFKDYRFLASVTSMLSSHFADYAKVMVQRFHPKTVVEFGSNDGVLLKPFMDLGVKAIGVEPANNIAEVARSKGCFVVNDFFTEDTAMKISSENGKVDMICANNVFAHIDDMQEVMRGIKALLKPDGVFVFEVHYLLDLVKTLQYDMIYHEHLMYHSVTALKHLLNSFGMEIFEVKRIPIHSGSIRVYSQIKGTGKQKTDKSVEDILDLEKKEDLDKEEVFFKFGKDVFKKRDEIENTINELKKEGKKTVGYGASGRSVIHLNFSNLTKDKIEYVVDESPERVGRLVPGVRIPIVKPEFMRKDMPDYAILFAYNYESEVLKKEKDFINGGGKFIIPIPEIRIVP